MRKRALQLRICSWCCGCERCGGKRREGKSRGSVLRPRLQYRVKAASRMECQCETYTSKDHLFTYTLFSPCYGICPLGRLWQIPRNSNKVIPSPCNFSALIICFKEINNSRQLARISFLIVSELTASMLVQTVMKSTIYYIQKAKGEWELTKSTLKAW